MTEAEAEIEIRLATPDDAEGVTGLLEELEHPAPVELVRQRLGELEESETTWVLVATHGDEVVGSATLQLANVIHQPGPVARMSTMIVTESWRGCGIGQAMVQAMEGLARHAGCGRMEVTSHRRREEAHRFYERLGYEDTSKRFIKDLS